MNKPGHILLTGATGYVGGRLLPLLVADGWRVRCLARRPGHLSPRVPPGVEVVPGDLLDASSLSVAMQGVETAFYLVHSLGATGDFETQDRLAAENFAAVAREVSRKIENCVWLAFGGAGDWKLCDAIAQRASSRVVNLAGKTSLRQLMALLKLCRLVLTNDTGPMHVAAALGTEVIVPFGSTSPGLTGPGLPGDPRHQLLQSVVPCSPCFRRKCPIDFRCMTGISPGRVIEAITQSIALPRTR